MPYETTKHIVITGANGYIGSALVRYFSQKKYAVTALVRKKPTVVIENVDYQLYELESNVEIPYLTSNSIVIHCAYSKTKNEPDSNISAAKHLLNEARRIGVSKCVFLSSISVLSTSESYYSQQKKTIEKLFDSKNDLIVRPSLVVGNGGLFAQTLQTLQKTKLLPLINGGNQPIYYVGINDLLRYIDRSIKNNLSGIHQITNPKPILYKNFYATITQQLGLKIMPIQIPLFLMKTVVFLNSFLPKPFLTKDNLKGLMQSPTLEIDNSVAFEYQSLEEILTDLKR